MSEITFNGNLVQWRDTNGGTVPHQIFRSSSIITSKSLPVPLGTVVAGVTEYLDTTAEVGETYFYAAAAVGEGFLALSSNCKNYTNYIPTQLGGELAGGIYLGNLIYGNDVYAYIWANSEDSSDVISGENYFIPEILETTESKTTISTTQGVYNRFYPIQSVYSGVEVTASLINAVAAYPNGESPVLSFVENFNVGGFEDWFLATAYEMQLLFPRNSPLFDIVGHPSSNPGSVAAYWTSSIGNYTISENKVPWGTIIDRGRKEFRSHGTVYLTHPDSSATVGGRTPYVRPMRRIKIGTLAP